MNERNRLQHELLAFISALYRDGKIESDDYLAQCGNVSKLRSVSYAQGMDDGVAIANGTYKSGDVA